MLVEGDRLYAHMMVARRVAWWETANAFFVYGGTVVLALVEQPTGECLICACEAVEILVEEREATLVLGHECEAGAVDDIVDAQAGLWNCVPQFLGLLVFAVAGVAETKRVPFDMPEAEAELVAGYHTEYSGMKFGMFFVGEYLGVTLISASTGSSCSIEGPENAAMTGPPTRSCVPPG